MARVTIRDVAEAAGVSVATVDRVLNGRVGEASRSARRVEEAIARLGYAPSALSARVARTANSFVFVLPDGANPFVAGLAGAVEQLGDWLPFPGARYEVRRVDVFDGPRLGAVLTELAGLPLAGVALVALDHPAVREGINRLAEARVPVVTLVSDMPSSKRERFIGIDNTAAGRTAGALMGRFLSGRRGKVAIVAGALALRDHAERQLGFRQVLAEEFHDIAVVEVREGRDEPAATRAATAAILAAHPDLAGIYNVGAGSAGVVEAVAAAGRTGAVTVIAHELTAANRTALIEGRIDAVINQDSGHEVRSAARVLQALAAGLPIVDAQERIRIDVFLRENLP